MGKKKAFFEVIFNYNFKASAGQANPWPVNAALPGGRQAS
jgi:hypothetical protein